MAELKARVFEITSQEPYLTEDKIKVGLSHKTIKQAVYILHDKDVYTEKTVEKERKRLLSAFNTIMTDTDASKRQALEKEGIKDFDAYYAKYHVETVGAVKTKHWHCYIRMDAPQEIKTIAKWFDTAAQNVEIKKGAGAFVDCIEYAVHDSESAKSDGKYGYPWEELHTVGMTLEDAIEMVRNKQVRRLKYGKDLSEKEALRMRVLKEGMTLRDAYDKYPLQYADDYSALARCRSEYLAHSAEIPPTRYNFFIQGAGGVGKDTVGRGLARQFYPGKSDEDIFHVVKDIDVPFEGYDGQPVIIWEDVRSQSLIQRFGRDGVFRLFDISITKGRYNVKYGSMPLTNQINILTSVENYTTFLNNLAGEYTDRMGNQRKAEDKGQAYRRFPFIIPIQMDYMDILVQASVLNGDTNYFEYQQYNRMRGNLAQMMWDNRIKGLPEDKRKELQSAIENKYMQGALGGLVKLVEDNKGLYDKGITEFNDLMEEMLGAIDDMNVVSEPKSEPACCAECPHYSACEDWKWDFCPQPYKDTVCPFPPSIKGLIDTQGLH